MSIKYVIFDLDGVIFNGAPLHREAFIKVISDYGVTSERYNDMFKDDDSKSMSSKQKIDKLNTQDDIFIPFEEFYKKKNIVFFKMIEDMDTLYDTDKYDMIFDLYNEGYILGIATNCSPETTMQILSRMDIVHYFVSISSGYEVNNPKPSSDVIHKCYKDFGIENNYKEQSKSIYFDDTEKGAAAGHDTPSHVVLTHPMVIENITYNYIKDKIKGFE